MKQHPLPAVVSPVAPDLRRFLDRVRETINDPKNFVTKEELASTGAFISNLAGVLEAVPLPAVEGVTSEEVSCVAPPAPSGLETSGAMTSIMLLWDGVGYGVCYSHTEVWRSDVEDIGAAILIGTTAAGMYVDAVGSSAQYYYWVRFVNIKGDSGAYNQTIGTLGETAPDVGYLIDQLSDAYGSTSEAPFFQIDTATTINGVEIPAGTYMKAAYIYDAAITNAMIGNLAVDTANIALLAVDTAQIANLAVTNAQIENLNASKLNAGYIHADRIDAGTITANKIVVGNGAGAITPGYIGAATSASVEALETFRDTTLPADLAIIQNQLDGSITTWFKDVAPTLANVPASSWSDNDTKNIHLGDLYYNRTNGYAYRFAYEDIVDDPNLGVIYSWVQISDTDIAAALGVANDAQDTADDKRRVFVVTPTTPYDKGDLWSDGADLKKCKTAKATGTYSASHWNLATDYTDDAAADIIAGNLYYPNTTEIDGGNIRTGTLTATSLSSIVADLGTITAGKMQSSDGKFVIDLDSKTISIET